MVIQQTQKKPEETIEFKLTKSREPFHILANRRILDEKVNVSRML